MRFPNLLRKFKRSARREPIDRYPFRVSDLHLMRLEDRRVLSGQFTLAAGSLLTLQNFTGESSLQIHETTNDYLFTINGNWSGTDIAGQLVGNGSSTLTAKKTLTDPLTNGVLITGGDSIDASFFRSGSNTLDYSQLVGGLELRDVLNVTQGTNDNVLFSSLKVDGGSLTLSHIDNDFDYVSFNVTGSTTLYDTDDLLLFGTNRASQLTITADGLIGDNNADTQITNNAIFTAGTTITLADDPSGTGIEQLIVGGLASFEATSGSSIRVGVDATDNPSTAVTQFGQLRFVNTFATGSITIHEDNATTLDGGSQANDLVLSSGGNITDSSPATLTVADDVEFRADGLIELADGAANSLIVTGQASFISTLGNDIRVGVDAFDADSAAVTQFGTLTLTSDFITATVTVHEDSSISLAGENRVGAIKLSTDQSISDSDAAIIVLADASFLATTTISLANDTNANGNGTTRDVLTVAGLATFHSSSRAAIDVGKDLAGQSLTQFDQLDPLGGSVTIESDSGVTLASIDVDALTLTAAGNVDQTAVVNVTGNSLFTLSAGSDLILGDATNQMAGPIQVAVIGGTGALGNVTLANDSATASLGTIADVTADLTISFTNASVALPGQSVGGNLSVQSGGQITDLGDIIVGGNASFTAVSGITLGEGGESHNFASLTFNSGGLVQIREDADTILTGTNQADELILDSNGQLEDEASTSITVKSGDAIFSASGVILLADDPLAAPTDGLSVAGRATFNGTGDIRVGVDAGSPTGAATEFGGLRITTTNPTAQVEIHQDTSVTLVGTSNAHILFLSSGGNITDTDAVLQVTDSATFTAVGSIDLASDVNGNGDGSTTDILNIAGRASFTSYTPANIDVGIDTGGQALVQFGSVDADGNQVRIREDDDVALAGINAATLDVSAIGDISDVGDAQIVVSSGDALFTATGSIELADNLDATGPDALSVSGAASFQAGPNSSVRVGVDGTGDPSAATTTLGSLATSGDDVRVAVDGSLTLSTNSADTLTLFVDGDVLQIAAATVSTSTDLTVLSGASVRLNDAGNNLAGSINIVSTGGPDEINDLELVSQAAGLTWDAPATINGDLTINFSAANVDIIQVDVGGGASITSGGNITDSGDVTVAGNASFTANGSITLGEGAENHDFGTLTFSSPSAVSIREASSIQISGNSEAGSLTLTAAGSLTDAEDTQLRVLSGNSTFNASGLIELADDPNGLGADELTVSGTARFLTNSLSNVRVGVDVAASPSAAFTQFGGLGATGRDVRIAVDSGIALDTISTDALLLMAQGDITQTAASNVAFGTTLTVSSGSNVLMNHAANDLSGLIIVSVLGGGGSVNDIHLVSTASSISWDVPQTIDGSLTLEFANSDIDLPTITVGANLSITSGGDITDSGDVTAASSNASFTTGNSITLGEAGENNNFGTLTFSAPGTVSIRESSSMRLTGDNQAGTLTLTSAGSITDAEDARVQVLFGDATFNVAGLIELADNPDGVGPDELTVTGTATFLTLPASDVRVGVTAAATPSAALTLFDSLVASGQDLFIAIDSGISLGTIIADSFSITAQGNITQIAAATVASGTAPSVSAGGDVLMNHAANDLSGPINVSVLGGVGAVNDVHLVSTSSTVLLSSAPAIGGDLTIDFANSSVDLPTVTIGGDLSVTAGSNITDSGNVSAASGNTRFIAGGSITLGDSGEINNFATLTFSSPAAVTIQESSGTQLLGDNQAGTLNLIATAGITDAEDTRIRVLLGDATFNAGGLIELADNPDGIGPDELTVTGTASFLTNSSSDVRIGVTAAGTPSDAFTQFGELAAAGQDLVIAVDGGILLGAISADTFSLATQGDITQAAAATVTNGTNLTVVSGGNVRMNHAANSLSGLIDVSVASGVDDVNVLHLVSTAAVASWNSPATVSGDLSINFSAASVDIPQVSVDGNISISAGGNITDSGDVTAAGNASFAAGGLITLDDDNNFGTLTFSSAGPVSVREDSGIHLLGNNQSGTLVLAANGNITDADNAGLRVLSGDATFNAFGAIELADNPNGAGPDELTVTGIARFNASPGNDVRIGVTALGSPSAAITQFGGLAATARDVHVAEDGATALDTISADSLTLTSQGDVTQTAAASISNGASLTVAAGSSVRLNHAANNVSALISVLVAGGVGAVNDLHLVNLATAAMWGSSDINGDLTIDFANSDVDLPSVIVAGNLSITSGANITDSGNVSAINGNGRFVAGGSITLGESGEILQLQSISFQSPGSVAIQQSSNVNLSGSNNAGSLFLSSTGNLTDADDAVFQVTAGGATFLAAGAITLADDPGGAGPDALTTSGQATFHSTGGGDIRVGVDGIGAASTATTQFGSLSFISQNPAAQVRVFEDDATQIVGLNQAGVLELGSSSGVSDVDAAVIVVGDTSITAGGAITLAVDSNGNGDGFTRDVLTVGGAASFVSTTNGPITIGVDSAGLAIATFGSLNVQGGTVTVEGDGDVSVSGIVSTSLNLTATGDISQSGAIQTGVAAFAVSPGGQIVLANTNNDFTGAVSIGTTTGLGSLGSLTFVDRPALSLASVARVAGSATVSAGSAMVLPTWQVDGNLSVTAEGGITQTGSLGVGGDTTLTVTNFLGFINPGYDIILDGFSNTFAGQIQFVSSPGVVRDIALRNASTTATIPTLPTGLRNLSLELDNAGIALPSLSITGDLHVTAHGDITQSGAIAVGDSTDLEVTLNGAGINLSTPGNSIAGITTFVPPVAGRIQDITLRNDSTTGTLAGTIDAAGDVVFTFANSSLTLPQGTVSGNLTVSSGGDVSQTGPLTVDGTFQIDILSLAASVDLNSAGNDFEGSILIQDQPGAVLDVYLRNANSSATVPTLPANLRDLTLNFDNAPVTLPSVDLSRNLHVVSRGGISQLGAVKVDGTTRLEVTQSGFDILLGTPGNEFDGLIIFVPPGTGRLRNVELRSESSTASLAGLADVQGNLTLTFPSASVVLPAATVDGNLTVTSGGDITQSGVLSILGATILDVTVSGSDVVLDTFANQLDGPLSVTSAPGVIQKFRLRNTSASAAIPLLPAQMQDLTLVFDNASIALPAIDLLGDLSVSSFGTISQLGDVQVNGTTTLEVAGNGSDILLNRSGNAFDGLITIIPPTVGRLRNVELYSTSATALMTGLADVSGDLGLSFVNADVTLPTANIDGRLNVIAGGRIDQSGPVSVLGFTALETLGANADVLLSHTGNQIAGPIVVDALGTGTLHDVSLTSQSGSASLAFIDRVFGDLSVTFGSAAVVLPELTVDGNLLVTSGSHITQSGVLTAASNVTLNAAGANTNVQLTNSNNWLAGAISVNAVGTGSLDQVSLTSQSPTVSVSNIAPMSGSLFIDFPQAPVALPSLNVNGALTIFSGGQISQTAAWSVSGSTNLWTRGPNSDIVVAMAGNQLAGSVQIGVIGIGSLDDVQVLTQSATASLASVSPVAGDLTLTFTNGPIALPALTVSGNIVVTAGGNLTQTGSLLVQGTTTANVSGPSTDIVWSDPLNQLGIVTVTSATNSMGDLQVRSRSPAARLAAIPTTIDNLLVEFSAAAVDLPGVHVTGDLQIGSFGSITQQGSLRVDGDLLATVSLANSDVLLDDAANLLAGPISVSSSGLPVRDIHLHSESTTASLQALPSTVANLLLEFPNAALVLPSVQVLNQLTATAGGLLTDTVASQVLVDGLAILTGPTITLGQQNQNHHLGQLTFTSAGDVQIELASPILLAGNSTGNNVNLTTQSTINDTATASLVVIQQATFEANQVRLGDGSAVLTAGGLSFDANDFVELSLDGTTMLAGNSQASQLTLLATGNIANAVDATVTIVGDALFQTGGTIRLAENSANQVNVQGQAVFESLSNGALDIGIIVVGAGAGGPSSSQTGFGSVVLRGGAVRISEDSDMLLDDVSATSLTAISSGVLRDSGSANLIVTGPVFLSGNSIVVGETNETVQFGSVQFISPGLVEIHGDSAMNLSGPSSANSMLIDSNTGIADSGSITVVGNTTFRVFNNAGGPIDLDNAGSSFGNLRAGVFNRSGTALTNGLIRIVESGIVDIVRIETAGSVNVQSGAEIRSADSLLVNVVASNIQLAAQTGIGRSQPLSVSSPTITATSTNGDLNLLSRSASLGTVTIQNASTQIGNISVEQLDGASLTVTSATTQQGNIRIVNHKADLTATSIQSSTTGSGNGDVWLETRGFGDIALGQVTARDDRITLRSAGSVNDRLGDPVGDIDLRANVVDIDAATGVGITGSIRLISSTASVDSANGHVNLELDSTLLSGTIQLTSVTTGVGSVDVDQFGGRPLFVGYAATFAGDISLANLNSDLTVQQANAGGTRSSDGQLLLAASGLNSHITVGSISALGDAVQLDATGGVLELGSDPDVDIAGRALCAVAPNGFGTTSNPIETAVEFVEINGGSGGVAIQDVGSLTIGGAAAKLSGVTISNGQVFISAGSLLVQEAVIHNGGGNIWMTSASGDIDIASPIRVVGGPGTITANSAGTVLISNGGEVQTTTGRVAALPTGLTVTPVDLGGSTVDVNGMAMLDVLLPDPQGTNFEITINWGDVVDTFPPLSNSGSLGNSTGPPFDGGVTHRFMHVYLTNPNLNNAAATIPVSVSAEFDFRNSGGVDNGIHFFAEGGTRIVATVMVDLVPPGQGIAPALSIIHTAPAIDVSAPPTIATSLEARVTATSYTQFVAETVGSGNSVATPEKRVVLRVVSPAGDEGDDIEMDLAELSNLTNVLKRLPDNHYRVYLILEDGTARLVRDVAVRHGRPVDPTSQSDEVPERPPVILSQSIDTAQSTDAQGSPTADASSRTITVSSDKLESDLVAATTGRNRFPQSSDSDGEEFNASKQNGLLVGAAAASAALATWQGYRTLNRRRKTLSHKPEGDSRNPFSRAARWARRIRASYIDNL